MTTIEIIGGCSTSTTRMILKREMERFGHVDVCHMGNRDDPKNEPPWVRFADSKSADNALEAIKGSQVIIDGLVIAAQRSNRRGPPLVSREPGEADVGSRELFLQRMGGGGGGGGGEAGVAGVAVVVAAVVAEVAGVATVEDEIEDETVTETVTERPAAGVETAAEGDFTCCS
eukprot:CAMPEP_0206480332 /NCGR_PEP_ID=MMETSP0324_2-20121206/37228_1 /ASSEMBLY_ACC=CAM_ASM_000836 /TAXON_ID=2866 /ORGANISM="Crypthecodinium cohnii, Strain Seligo" /LENGTH=172 /DNA_ID=CAMNT_0053957093 /DNA_START=37 /DNA_END=556 /DNA_ORIENTATION=+